MFETILKKLTIFDFLKIQNQTASNDIEYNDTEVFGNFLVYAVCHLGLAHIIT